MNVDVVRREIYCGKYRFAAYLANFRHRFFM